MGLKLYSSRLEIDEGTADFIKQQIDSVPSNAICGVVFCGVIETMEYGQLLSLLKDTLYQALGRRVPVTLIPQHLLPQGGLSMDIYTLEEASEIEFSEQNGVCYGIISNSKESLLFVEGIPASDFTQSVRTQSSEVFGRLENILTANGFAANDIVRQWNYIGNIVGFRAGKQNYQEFNDARSLFYGGVKWHNGYPAATGIGVWGEGIIIGAIAFKSADKLSKAIYPIDNPLQVAAHIYSKSVLIDDAAEAMKSTPKFERAKIIKTQRGVCCFVSGTAAIRGEQSVDSTSAKEQTIKTIENIDYLISKENLIRYGCEPYNLQYTQLQVFIKNKEDYNEVKAVVESVFPGLQVVYSVADVCRSELLVEIEGILIS